MDELLFYMVIIVLWILLLIILLMYVISSTVGTVYALCQNVVRHVLKEIRRKG